MIIQNHGRSDCGYSLICPMIRSPSQTLESPSDNVETWTRARVVSVIRFQASIRPETDNELLPFVFVFGGHFLVFVGRLSYPRNRNAAAWRGRRPRWPLWANSGQAVS